MAGSTLPRRSLGRLLRDLRLKAEKSQLAASRVVEISPQGIGRLEDGQSIRISELQINGLLDFYDAAAGSRADVLELFEEVKESRRVVGRKDDWWRGYSAAYASHFDHYLRLEEAAKRLTMFQVILLPGLLQTPDYRRSMARCENPALSAADVDKQVELAMRRQARLEDGQLDLHVTLPEAVLRHHVGGSAVMSEQLRHLVDVSELPNVTIQVVPFGAGVHLGLLTRSFILLEFGQLPSTKLTEPPVVYVEEYTQGLYLEHETAIDRYRAACVDLQRVALDADQTRALVLDIVKEMMA